MAVYVYILRTKPDDSHRESHFYVGITNNLKRRMFEHKTDARISWVKRNGYDFDLVFIKRCANRKSAMKKEKYYKSMSKDRKRKLVML